MEQEQEQDMTEQQTITVEKIEHRPDRQDPWRVTLVGYPEWIPMTDEEFAATGLRYEPTIPITIGEQTVELTRDEAERAVHMWGHDGDVDSSDLIFPVRRKFAAALRAHLEAEQ